MGKLTDDNVVKFSISDILQVGGQIQHCRRALEQDCGCGRGNERFKYVLAGTGEYSEEVA